MPIPQNRRLRSLAATRCLLAVLLVVPAAHGQWNGMERDEFSVQRAGQVTVHELRHVVPPRARAEMEKADKARRKQNNDAEVEHLRKAIALNPEFTAARSRLAMSLMISDPESARAELEQAISIDPYQAVLFRNLAFAYLTLNQLDAAESAARTAKKLGAIDARARLLLGWVLIQKHNYSAEAETLITSLGKTFPLAYLLSARLFIGRGIPEQAQPYIQAYLSCGDKEYRDYALSWSNTIARSQRGNAREEVALGAEGRAGHASEAAANRMSPEKEQ